MKIEMKSWPVMASLDAIMRAISPVGVMSLV